MTCNEQLPKALQVNNALRSGPYTLQSDDGALQLQCQAWLIFWRQNQVCFPYLQAPPIDCEGLKTTNARDFFKKTLRP